MQQATIAGSLDYSAARHLPDLVEACLLAEDAYRNSASDARDTAARLIMTHCAQERAYYAAELETLAARHCGGERHGRVRATLRRAWLDVQALFEGDSDFALVTTCERADAAARAVYERALGAAIPSDVEVRLKEQYEGLRSACAELRRLRYPST